ncbi:MAG: toxin-antitoxin system HicB family antitoxin [Syntrophaceae bacterium]|nr:toxin-antitoxin system HicB family antitoxin [Syntrophaceae bacterium]
MTISRHAEKSAKNRKNLSKGAFNLRLDPSLHEILVTGALREGKTLNAFVKDVLERAVSEMHA